MTHTDAEGLSLHELVNLPWTRVIQADEDGRWIASVPELPGCFTADQPTPLAAFHALRHTLREWLEIGLEEGRPLNYPPGRDFAPRAPLNREQLRRIADR